ncbi:mitochondrial large subunit ribosomal protein-domain-containing protein [Chaetomium sp. MPI-CAGE-AT-0009]|nr:mitochondrial large subunit ribosomal protein-domain-containing protein [Chaetomium sp. MPI-CAGE-AT-0009]
MPRPATLLRAFAAPSRLALPKAAPLSITLAARNYATRFRSPALDLPYTVSRTPSKELPVYKLWQRGGSLKLTSIKKIEGDRAQFRTALAQALGMPEEDVLFNTVTGHCIVTGHRHGAIVEWLEKQGF